MKFSLQLIEVSALIDDYTNLFSCSSFPLKTPDGTTVTMNAGGSQQRCCYYALSRCDPSPLSTLSWGLLLLIHRYFG